MIICHCKEVTYKEIEHFLHKFPNANFNELRKGTGASTGCGRCSVSVRKTMENIKATLPNEIQNRLPFE